MISVATLPPAPIPNPVMPSSVLMTAMMADGICANGPLWFHRRGSSSDEKAGGSFSPSDRWLR